MDTNAIKNNDSGAPSPSQIEIKNTFEENDSYKCCECQSDIEILSIDKDNIEITYKCLNTKIQNNHGIKTMPINKYINAMRKNTYLYNICSSCKKIQLNEKNKLLFNFCIICQEIVCNECINLHTNNNRNLHYFIKNNEKAVFCMKHPQKRNIEYCIKCRTHLCIECLKSGHHFNHQKNNLIEVKPSEEKKDILTKYIDSLKKEKQKFEREKDKKSISLYNKLIKDQQAIYDIYDKFVEKTKLILKRKIDANKKNLISQLKYLKNQYEKNVKLKLDIFNQFLKNIKHEYKTKIEEFNINYNKNATDKVKSKYSNDQKFFLTYYNKKINDIKDLLTINEIIKNSQEKYEDNYYNNINFSSIVSCIDGEKKKNIIEFNNNIIENEEELKKEIEEDLKYQKSFSENQIIKKNNLKEIENLKKENEDLTNKYDKLLLDFETLKEENNKLFNENDSLNKIIPILKKFAKKSESKDLVNGYTKSSLNNTF